MLSWIDALTKVHREAQSYVLLTVLETRGSSPRDTGSKMLVTAKDVFDTIGGGALEHQSINIARNLLMEQRSFSQHTQRFNLGKDLKQCCGGVVTVFFEVFPMTCFNIVIFGAGHIGQSLVKILNDIDCQIIWFDSRSALFPKTNAAHVKMVELSEPEVAVESCQPKSYFLVMTHDHGLDQQICEAILSRKDSDYCGLIGSVTKGQKFRQRLLKKGYTQKELKALICPVGLTDLKSKKPMEIAVSICAQLLQLRGL